MVIDSAMLTMGGE